MVKNCKQCGKEFLKKSNCSNKDWKTRVKFCSKVCLNDSFLGKPAWNKGTKGIMKSNKGTWKKGDNVPKSRGQLGKHFTEEHKNKIRMSQIGKKRPTTSKENNPNWKGGITSQNHIVRTSTPYKLWRKSVFEQDDYTCQKCNQRGGDLIAHHINNFAEREDLRLAIDNGVTFCEDCHYDFHKTYGFTNNTMGQLNQYLAV